MKISSIALAFCAALGSPLAAQPTDFTTAEGAAYIHQQIKDQIVSFKPEGDQDIIYFTAILGWRCGMRELFYGINGGLAVNQFPLEPCYRELRSPNTMKDSGTTYPFFITVPTGSAQSVTLRAIYDDGTTATFVSERAKNLIN